MEKILVIIPYGPDQEGLAKQSKIIHELRAGIECTVEIIKDVDRKGWVWMHNEQSKREDYDIYVFSCADVWPGRRYLLRAYNTLKEKGVGMVGFNDGKWDGKNATVGMITKEYLRSNYEGGSWFYPGYKRHGADPDLAELSMIKNEFAYDPEALLIEIDIQKELGNRKYDESDTKLFMKRRKERFPRK